MSQSISQRRMVENEVVFRERNESVQKGFEELVNIAKEDGQESLINDNDEPLHFYCECADENCRERILLKPSKYKQIHKKRNRFIVIEGHDVKNIEKVVAKKSKYWVVEKFFKPPATASGLNPTAVDNT